MKVILFDNVKNVGNAGETVEVKAGFARNFLIPQKLAYPATKEYLARFEQFKKDLAKKQIKELEGAKQVADQLQQITLQFSLKAGEQDRLFGSVTHADIADKLKELGYNIDKKMIHLEDAIKRLGMYTVHIRLHSDITANCKVLVEKAE